VPKAKFQPQPQTVINLAPQNPETPEPEKPQEREEKEPGWFFGEMNRVPAGEWEKIYHLEIQRLEPKVPGVSGSKGYLWTFFAPVSLADIKSRWGGGKFRMDLCKNGHYFKTHNFDIEGDPIYDRSREIPPAASSNGNGLGGNADFQKEFISVLREELQRSRESNQGQSNGSEHVIEMLTKASDRAMEIVTKQAPTQTDPAAQVNALLAAAEKLANLRQPAGGGALGSLGDTLIAKLVEKLLNPPNPLEELTKLSGLFELVEKIRGNAGGGEPKDWKAAAVQTLTQHLPEILETFKATSPAITAQARAAEAQARARAAETLRVVPIDRSQPQTQPAAQPPAAAAPPMQNIRVQGGLHLEPRDGAATAVEGMPAAQPAPAPITQEQYDEGMKVQVVNMMRYGASGSAIATFLEDVKPDLAKDMVNYPEQTITQFFSQDPILKLMVEDPRWHEVLADARAYLSEDEVTVGPN
jgi:hypothetical protein